MQTNHVRLSPGEPTDLHGYRAISPLAIAAGILALASALALAHPVLWFVPAVAVALAVAALRSISANPDTLVGRKVALAALALALFFGAWAPTRLALERVVIPRQSRHFALYWLSLVREGRLYEAHQWTKSPSLRLPADVDLREYYEADTYAKEDLGTFLSQEAVRALLKTGRGAQVRSVTTVSVETRGQESLSVLDYEIATPPQSAKRLIVRIAVQRLESAGSDAAQWRVAEVRLAQPAHLPVE